MSVIIGTYYYMNQCVICAHYYRVRGITVVNQGGNFVTLLKIFEYGSMHKQKYNLYRKIFDFVHFQKLRQMELYIPPI